MTTHLLHHIPDGIQRFGPVHSTWMYAYERFNSWMGRRAMNRCLPEATIMATYRVCCVCAYMKGYQMSILKFLINIAIITPFACT